MTNEIQYFYHGFGGTKNSTVNLRGKEMNGMLVSKCCT